jgi:hypothetical protein
VEEVTDVFAAFWEHLHGDHIQHLDGLVEPDVELVEVEQPEQNEADEGDDDEESEPEGQEIHAVSQRIIECGFPDGEELQYLSVYEFILDGLDGGVCSDAKGWQEDEV